MELNKNNEASATVTPNPFRSNFIINVNEPKPTTAVVHVIDANGKQVRNYNLTFDAGTTVYEVNQLDDLSSGMYFVQILTESGNNYTIKLIKK